MKYIIPKYIEIKKEKDGLILKNNFIKGEVRITEDSIIDEIKCLQKNGTEKIENEVQDFLVKHKYLVVKDVAENDILLMKSYMDEVLIITLMPTMRCNFKCVYCYEVKEGGFLDFSAYEKIVDFIEEKLIQESIKILKINWFGGEPLLAFDDIIKFQKTLFDRIGKRVKIVVGMTTNGYLLTTDIYKELYSVGIKEYQITLDGTMHDMMRIRVDGKGTYHSIMNNLHNIVKDTNGYDGRIIIRTNVTKDTNLEPFFSELYTLFQDKRFYLNVKCVRDWGNLKLSCDKIVNPEKCADVELFINNLARKMKIRTLNENKMVTKEVCYALYKNSYIFKPNGEIVKCSLDLDNPRNVVGKIEKGKIIIDEEKNKRWDIERWKMSSGDIGCKRKEIMS